jgi:Ca2+-binding EF-hand superfamily protein
VALVIALCAVGYVATNSTALDTKTPSAGEALTERDIAILGGNQDSQDKADLVSMADTVENFEDTVEDMARRNPNNEKLQMLADVTEFCGDIFDDAKDPLQAKPTPRWTLLLKWIAPEAAKWAAGGLAGMLVFWMVFRSFTKPTPEPKPQSPWFTGPCFKDKEIERDVEYLFKAADLDGDGLVDAKEFVSSLGHFTNDTLDHYCSGGECTMKQWKAYWANHEADHSTTKRELEKLKKNVQAAQKARERIPAPEEGPLTQEEQDLVEEVFRLMDFDRDGFIDGMEYSYLASRMNQWEIFNLKIPSPQANEDGNITREAMLAFAVGLKEEINKHEWNIRKGMGHRSETSQEVKFRTELELWIDEAKAANEKMTADYVAKKQEAARKIEDARQHVAKEEVKPSLTSPNQPPEHFDGQLKIKWLQAQPHIREKLEAEHLSPKAQQMPGR